MGGTGTSPSGYRLDISEPLFRLTTEGLRLRSNETQSFQTLANLLDARSDCAARITARPIATLREHLAAIPSKGTIRIEFRLSRRSTEFLAKVKDFLCRELAQDMSLADALSVLLFDYVIEQKAARVLETLDLDDLLPDHGTATASRSTH